MMDVIKRVNLDLDFSFYRVYLGLKPCKFQLMYSSHLSITMYSF